MRSTWSYFPLSWDVLIRCSTVPNYQTLSFSVISRYLGMFSLDGDVKVQVVSTKKVISRYLGMFSLDGSQGIRESRFPVSVISRYLGMFSLDGCKTPGSRQPYAVISRYLGMFSLDDKFNNGLLPEERYFPLSWDVLIR